MTPEIVPRWEWRTFGDDLEAAERLLDESGPGPVQDSDEVYLVSLDGDASVKVRGGQMDVKLREAVKFEGEAGAKPGLVIVEGFDLAGSPRDELTELRALAGELPAEIWLSGSVPGERVAALPASLGSVADLLSVVLALEPGDSAVALRALKDHGNPDLSALHVALDPKTLLLKRS